MTLDISAVTPRVQYTVGSTPDSTFDYSFAIFEDADISVYVGSTKKTLTTHYTVSGAGTTSGGTVTMTTGNAVSNATVTLVRNITIARTTDFPASGAFQVDSLNTELDRITAVQQELEDDIGRSLRLADEDATATLTIPLKDARKGRYLAFNATTGNAEAGPTQTDATLIATVTTDIALLADIQDGTTATNAITTLAGIHGNVTTVAGVASNVTTIATGTTGGNSNLTNLNTIATGTTGGNANLTQINAVASDLTDINTVAGKATEIGRLGTSDAVADMALLGDSAIIADMALLAVDTVIADMALLAVPEVITDMDILGGSGVVGKVTTVADNISDVTTVADNISTISAKAPLASPALTGTPTAPTASANTNTTQIATTAYVQTELADMATLASPALTGNPTAPTQSASDNSTKIATTAYVDNQVATENTIAEMDDVTLTSIGDNEILQYNNSSSKFENQTLAEAGIATIASPTFTGTPAGPTASASTNTTQLATTAFVQTEISSKASKGFATAMAIAL